MFDGELFDDPRVLQFIRTFDSPCVKAVIFGDQEICGHDEGKVSLPGMTDIHPSGELHCLREAERKLFPDIQHLRIRVKDIEKVFLVSGQQVMDAPGCPARDTGGYAA